MKPDIEKIIQVMISLLDIGRTGKSENYIYH